LSSYDNSPGILLIQLTNAAKAKIDGLETNANFNMGDSWSGDAGVSFIPRAEYLDFPDAAVFRQKGGGVPGNLTIAPYDASGTRMIRTPRVTFNAGLNWHTMLLGGRAEAGATYYYNSGFLFAPGEVNPLAAQDAYKIVNAHLSWTAPSGHYTFTLFGDNLTNTYYGTYQNDNALGDAIAFSRPRVTGIRFSYTY
jgi:iron complex outermembrane receptor protein